MNPLQVEYFRQKLLRWRADLIREADGTLASLSEGGILEPDITDRASVETDRALELRTRDRAARERGTAMIAALTDLQRAMLTEEDPALALRSLSALAVDGPLADDPELAAVLRAVVLRSRVEVARRGRRAY